MLTGRAQMCLVLHIFEGPNRLLWPVVIIAEGVRSGQGAPFREMCVSTPAAESSQTATLWPAFGGHSVCQSLSVSLIAIIPSMRATTSQNLSYG